jgi:uncharacterized protein (TIGR02217 family)
MSQVFFPTLPGLSWSVHKKPIQSTRVAKHVSGRSVRVSLYAWPLWSFELTYQVLRADSFHRELQTLMGFFLARQGQYDSFLFEDPTDCQVTGQLLGTGTGSQAAFTFLHPMAANLGEPVGQVETDGLNVYLGGVLQPSSAYTVTLPATLTFGTAPAAGAAVTADYTYYFKVSFDEDTQDYENFMQCLWSLQSCKFTSVKP